MLNKKMILLLIVLTAVMIAASLHTYYIRTQAGGDLFWNADEAYVFLDIGARGYRFSYLQEFYWRVREAFGDVRLRDREHHSVVVLRVTPETVQRYVVDDMHPGSFDFFDGSIYAGDLDKEGGLLKWTGTHFEQPSPEEQRKLKGGAALANPPSFRNVNGWSKQQGLGLKEFDYQAEFPIELGGKPITLVAKSVNVASELSIDLLRPGRPPERIWYLDQRPRRVSKAEYERQFARR